MKITVGLTTVALLTGMTFTPVAEAEISNGGFEQGFSSWQGVGDLATQTSAFGSGPIAGNSQAFLSTAFQEFLGFDENGVEISGGNAVSANSLSGLLGNEFTSLATGAVIEGSAIQQTFTGEFGDKVNFSWNFLTDETVGVSGYRFNDYAFAVLRSELGTEAFLLADTFSSFTASGSETAFFNETGFKTFSYPIQTGVTYTLAIGVVDVGTVNNFNSSQLISGLLVDDVKVVPETTSTLGLLFVGALATAQFISQHHRRNHDRRRM